MPAIGSVYAWAGRGAVRPSVPPPRAVARPRSTSTSTKMAPQPRRLFRASSRCNDHDGVTSQTQRNPSSCLVFSFGVTPTMTVGGWFVNGSQRGIDSPLRAAAICGIRTATWQPYWPHRVAQPAKFVATNTRCDRGRALGHEALCANRARGGSSRDDGARDACRPARARCRHPPHRRRRRPHPGARPRGHATESRSPRSRLGTYRVRRHDVAGGVLVDDR